MDDKPSFLARARFLAIAGVGFFADGYFQLTIGLVVPMLGYIYFKDNKNAIPTDQAGVVKAAHSIGMVVGQIGFGFLGDAFGRHSVYGRELLFTIFGTMMCILLPWNGLSHDGIIAWMSVFRVFVGFGTGGDYPTSASLAAEKAGSKGRPIMHLTVFFLSAMGNVAAAIVLVILLAAFKGVIENNVNGFEWVWRLLLGLGLIPLFLTVYARFVMKETTPYEKYKPKEKRGARDQFKDFKVYFSNWRHAAALFSCCAVWFLYDLAYTGVALNQAAVLSSIGYGVGPTPYLVMWNTAVGNVIVFCAGYLPGFVLSTQILPYLIGRRVQMFWGSILIVLTYVIWAGVTKIANTGALLFLFVIGQLFFCAGPVITAYLPVELFPTRVRASAYGLAAAWGKIGSIVAAFAFSPMMKVVGLAGVLGFFAALMFIVALLQGLIPESKDCTIEEIESDVLYKRKLLDFSRDKRKADRAMMNESTEEEVESSTIVTESKNLQV